VKRREGNERKLIKQESASLIKIVRVIVVLHQHLQPQLPQRWPFFMPQAPLEDDEELLELEQDDDDELPHEPLPDDEEEDDEPLQEMLSEHDIVGHDDEDDDELLLSSQTRLLFLDLQGRELLVRRVLRLRRDFLAEHSELDELLQLLLLLELLLPELLLLEREHDDSDRARDEHDSELQLESQLSLRLEAFLWLLLRPRAHCSASDDDESDSDSCLRDLRLLSLLFFFAERAAAAFLELLEDFCACFARCSSRLSTEQSSFS